MRKLLISFILLTLCAFANAQSSGQVKVVRTDGTTIIGVLQSTDCTAVSIKIAGVEMTIPMSEVQSIEEYSNAYPESKLVLAPESTQNLETAHVPNKELSAQYGDYIVTDNIPAYPESFTIEVAGQKFTMVLVRGGSFNMGYDDWKSRKMDSEPVHRVDLSSYYVSDDFIDVKTACDLLSIIDKKAKKKNMRKYVCNWANAKRLVDVIAAEQGSPYRLITEAEWEYATIQPVQELVFRNTEGYTQNENDATIKEEWCYDFYDKYTEVWQQNPTGPLMKDDNPHVARSYEMSSNRNWARIKRSSRMKCFVRLAISADKIPTLNK